jgi:hypothetical protein
MKTVKAKTLFFVLIVFLLTSCVAQPTQPVVYLPLNLVTQDPNATSTATPFQPAPVNGTLYISPTSYPSNTLPAPTDTATATLIPPTNTPQPVEIVLPTNTFTQPAPVPVSARTNYILYTSLDFANRSLTTDETIRYYNTSGTTLYDIVLSVQPNLYINCFTLTSIAQDGTVVTNYSLNTQRLTVTLPQPLQPNAATTLSLSFSLALPYKQSDRPFGYDFNQINLTDWYPFVVPYVNGWVLHDPLSYGEHLAYDASDVELNLKVNDPNVTVAASGLAEANGEWTRYRLYGARTFALSASNEFLVKESAVGATVIRSYYFAGYEGGAEGILNAAVAEIGLFNAKFAPFPYGSLAIVQTDINDGQEYDGLVFIASDFYSQYGGSPKSNLITIGVHEIAHQWWFGLVGNDQATEPWLDEAMSVYSERIYYEYVSPRNLSWWWSARVNYYGPGGYVDNSIYSGASFRPYTNSVYLNGALFIEDLRTRIGDDAFFSFIKDYATRFSRARATTTDFFNVLREHTDADFSDLMSAYFQGSY